MKIIMIPFDFEYYKPDSIIEAIKLFQKLDLQNKEPLYYGGGTEIISFARKNDISTKAVIDIKGIPECNVLENRGNILVIGSGLTITKVSEANIFPLFNKTAGGVADHTSRDKITIGGNINGRVIYKEAVLPFLLCDSLVVIAGSSGLKAAPINQVFNENLNLKKGEFLVQLITKKYYVSLPYMSIKKTRISKIEYPLVTVASLKKDSWIRTAFSGVYNYPFRSKVIEEELNNISLPPELRVENAICNLPAPVMNNIQGSAGYREFVLKNTLIDILKALEAK